MELFEALNDSLTVRSDDGIKVKPHTLIIISVAISLLSLSLLLSSFINSIALIAKGVEAEDNAKKLHAKLAAIQSKIKSLRVLKNGLIIGLITHETNLINPVLIATFKIPFHKIILPAIKPN